MFTFANPFLLWAFPVLALPWIFRRRREDQIQHIDFPLIRFLLEAEEKDFINPQLQELLLLVLRTLLLALILLALAGPRWQANSASSGLWSWLPFASALQQQVAVIDSSYSMGYDDGQETWMARANNAWNLVSSSLGGVALRTYRWDATTLGANTPAAFNQLSRAEIDILFEEPPVANGASANQLFEALEGQLSGGERIVILTDGQRAPWNALIDEPVNAASVPACVVAIAGSQAPYNLWFDIESYSMPPWGVAGWESFTGNAAAKGWQEPVDGGLTITRVDADEDVMQIDVSFPANMPDVQRVPFSYTAAASEFGEALSNQETYSSQWRIQIEPNDPLPIDNQLEFTIPIQTQFNLALAADETAPSPSLAIVRASIKPDNDASGPIQISYLPGSLAALAIDTDWLLLNPDWRAQWTAADTSLALEFARQGGAILVLSGGAAPQGEWAGLFEELGWQWLPTNADATLGEISFSSGSRLGAVLSVWPPSAWNGWHPNQHGLLNRNQSQPAAAYSYGGATAHTLVGFTLGQGKVWVLNTPLSPDGGALLSPLLPAILWELAKDAARNPSQGAWTPPPRRLESDLTMLSTEDRQLLNERYGIQFVELDSLRSALSELQGGVDLRILLIFLCLLVALVESWLANRLASL